MRFSSSFFIDELHGAIGRLSLFSFRIYLLYLPAHYLFFPFISILSVECFPAIATNWLDVGGRILLLWLGDLLFKTLLF